jgi:hypothetical protein
MAAKSKPAKKPAKTTDKKPAEAKPVQLMMTHSFKYGGFGVQRSPLDKPRKVTLLGVMLPVDPGMVRIRDGDKECDVPSLTLKDCPLIDYGALLTDEQKRVREALGLMYGNGVGGEQTLLPLDKCPLTTLAAINAKHEAAMAKYRKSKGKEAKDAVPN